MLGYLGWRPGRLPSAVLSVAAAVRTNQLAGRAVVTPSVRVRVGGGESLTVRASRQQQRGGAERVAVVLQPTPPEQIAPLVARAAGLTKREQQVAALAGRRMSESYIADRLFISRHTVHDHLKSVFDKLDVHTRGELAEVLYLAQTG